MLSLMHFSSTNFKQYMADVMKHPTAGTMDNASGAVLPNCQILTINDRPYTNLVDSVDLKHFSPHQPR